ncbi:MAG: hypothetical protein PH343_10705 [Nitrospira sp.]|nr:hypothetical protein [Nitrospira sp.]
MHLLQEAPWTIIKIVKHPYRAETLGKKAKGPFYKVICLDTETLKRWARENGIPEKWIHKSRNGTPHIDLWGTMARRIEDVQINHGATNKLQRALVTLDGREKEVQLRRM